MSIELRVRRESFKSAATDVVTSWSQLTPVKDERSLDAASGPSLLQDPSPPAETRGPARNHFCSVPSGPASGAAELRRKPVFQQPGSQLPSLY